MIGALGAVSGQVAEQYEKWIYPPPTMDLSETQQGGVVYNGGDPEIFRWAYWPHWEVFPERLDMLVAGCGTTAAARYAYNHPSWEVVGIDLSAASLAHAHYLKEKHQLTNLSLHQCPIGEVKTLGKDFDFVDVTGVLHHIPEPEQALSALASVLRPEGVISIMLYGLHGRKGVYMLQEMFRLMGLEQDEASLQLVKDTLSTLKPQHFVQPYVREATDCNYDSGLVDTFLHRYDKGYTVEDCMALLAQSGMAFMGWKENFYYYPEGHVTNPNLLSALNAMSDRDIWHAMELIYGQTFQHRFHACHQSRDPKTYCIDFEQESIWDAVPLRRIDRLDSLDPTQNNGLVAKIQRVPSCPLSLGPTFLALFEQIDGQNTLRDCMEKAYRDTNLPDKTPEKALDFFKTLWRLGYVFLKP